MVLIVTGAGLLVSALHKRSAYLRLIANLVLVLAIAKVFLVDAADLDGLARAASFLVLGLVLAGLAWINRRASMRIGEFGGSPQVPAERQQQDTDP